MAEENKRQSNFELLRIICIIMIIACHFATHGKFNFGFELTLPRCWWLLIEMGGNFGVDVYVMISGYFLINNKNYKIKYSKALKLIGQALFYSIALYIFSVIFLGKEFEKSTFFYSFFPITNSNWWFLSTYFVMYLLHPYINKVLTSLSQKQYAKYIVMLLFMWSIIPTFMDSTYQSNLLLEFVLYYSIGAYANLYEINELKRKHFVFLYIIMSLIVYFSAIYKIIIREVDVLALYERYAFPTIARAFCFFMIFKKTEIKYNKTINTIASATFGVYLIHEGYLIRSYLWEDLFNVSKYQETLKIIPYSIATTCIVYFFCTVVELLRINTIEVLYMKLVTIILNKINLIYNRIKNKTI